MKKKILVAASAVALVLAFTFVCGMLLTTKPFEGIAAEEIESVTVELTPPGTQLTLSEPEIEAFAALLKKVEIYQKDEEQYAGQSVCFVISKTDGTQVAVTAYNPVLMIDGVSYKTKYEPCEALSKFANQLLREREGASSE